MKNTYVSFLCLLVGLSLLASCATTKNPYYSRRTSDWKNLAPKDETDLIYTVFLIGDAGAPNKEPLEPTLVMLKNELEKADERSAVIFLGDNVYSHGLSRAGAYDRKNGEERLNSQLNILKGYKGEKYMIPGNHDWGSGTGAPDGLQAVIREENYVEAYLKDTSFVTGGDFFVPSAGCPGPYEVRIHDNVVLIALNTQWWLHPYEKPYGENNYCNVASEVDFLVQIEDVIQKHAGKDIMVVGHHPLYSNGIHGGYFTLADHFFPVSIVYKYVFFPFPIIGSVYPWSRKYGGIIQDIPHPDYQAMKKGLEAIFNKYPNVVYAAGHEHNLQYFKKGEVHHIVSGSGCKTQHVKGPGGDQAEFTHKHKGFAKVNYYSNGEAWVEFWEPEGDGNKATIIYRYPMYARAPKAEEVAIINPTDYRDSSITVAANAEYRAGGLKKLLLGEHYRHEWRTPVKVPMLDMGTERGGLKPYKKGGGKQTASLKVRNPEGQEYTIRSINKDPSKVLPEALRETFARDLLQDQISAQHPYSALAIPKLADAAGVLHTNPKLVYVPNDPLLRQYLDEFGNTLAMIEEDADESHEDVESLAFSGNLVGTDKVLERLREDNDNQVNEKEFARARLLDMLIGDWDRHEGQWRWAEEKTDKARYFRPVPEDRDQAFFKADGFFPWLATRKWSIRNFQHFGDDFGDYVGLNLSALTVDRTFLSDLNRQDWIDIANDVKARVTDEAIEAALRDLPPEVYPISAPEIARKLKARREKLPEVAEKYYEHLAKMVDIAGSDKHERFEVKRLNNDQTQVTVYKTTKEGEVRNKIYERTFFTKETKEIRLYGLGGNDIFDVTGEVKKGIKIRIIAGEGEDRITDKSKVGSLGKQTLVYDDNTEKNTIDLGTEAKDKTEEFVEVNNYDRDNYKVSYMGPRISLEYNVDDGVFLGGGFVYRTHKFRKTPYAAEHSFIANYAFKTGGYNIRYNGDFKQAIGKYDLGLKASVFGPQFAFNYFGLGNDTEQDTGQDISFYRVRFSRVTVSPTINTNFTSHIKIGVGPVFDRFKVENDTEATFLRMEAEAGHLEKGSLEANQYLGGRFFMDMIAVSSDVNPRIGIKFLNEVSYNRQIDGENPMNYTNVSSQLMAYLSPKFPFQVTWAGRVGAAHNFGDFRFYQANTLGGTTNLRGYRRTRFAGRSAIYANTEARLELFKFNVYLFPGKFGLMGLADFGRVYADGDTDRRFFPGLHQGYGGGVWIDVLKQAVINVTYSAGEDERLYNLNFGFLF